MTEYERKLEHRCVKAEQELAKHSRVYNEVTIPEREALKEQLAAAKADAEALAVALDRIACSHHPKLVNCEVAWQEVAGFAASTLAAYRANHGAPDAGKEATWQTGTPPHSNPGTSADYFLCIPLYSDVPLVLIFLHEEKHWTQGGGDTQAVRCWMPIPSAPYGKDAK